MIFFTPTAGDVRALGENLGAVLRQGGIPLRVETIAWASGDAGRDTRDQNNQQAHGRHLAEQILLYRQASPFNRVCLVGHGAGGAVLLAACRWLPPGTVDRIVLFGPAVSRDYDLRRALIVSRQGIDVFHFHADRTLNAIVGLYGTTEGRRGPSAGEAGFAPITIAPGDALLYRKLRQYPYHSEFARLGHLGGHLGYAQPLFLARFLVPMLVAR